MNRELYEKQYKMLVEKGGLNFQPSQSLKSFIIEELMFLPVVNWKGIENILELGCGPGSLFENINFRGNVLSVDYSSTAIEFAKKRLKNDTHDHIRFICADIGANEAINSLKKGSIDLVFDSHCLHCLTQKIARNNYFRHSLNYLKKGGVLAMECMISHRNLGFDEHYSFQDNILSKDGNDLRYIPGCRELEEEILSYGFEIVYLRAFETLKIIPIPGRDEVFNNDPELVRIVARKI